ncbi:MAG: hypothetical protein JNK19_01190 [Tabrizicola sp.]|nr:hypothetical protein [Tabrizicola sp.]
MVQRTKHNRHGDRQDHDPLQGQPVAQFIARRVLELEPETQAEVASEEGFVDINFHEMLITGTLKLVLDRLPALAVLECDPVLPMRLALGQAVDATAARGLFGKRIWPELAAPLERSQAAAGRCNNRERGAWVELLRISCSDPLAGQKRRFASTSPFDFNGTLRGRVFRICTKSVGASFLQRVRLAQALAM